MSIDIDLRTFHYLNGKTLATHPPFAPLVATTLPTGFIPGVDHPKNAIPVVTRSRERHKIIITQHALESRIMSTKISDPSDPMQQRQMALSRWDNEGGAQSPRSQGGSNSGEARFETPHLTNAELVQLRIRMIALENLVITLLAETSDRRLDLAREMATYISPRAGFTHHPVTIHAAAQMIHLVDRADHFRSRVMS